jgi:hypothetical protein
VVVEESVDTLKKIGYAYIQGCIEATTLESTRNQIVEEYLQSLPLPWSGGGKWFGHINYFPSPIDNSILSCANSVALGTILRSIFGGDFRVVAVVGNANLPGSKFQPAHIDGRMGQDYVIVNVPLGSVNETNGATEIWERSHLADYSVLGEFGIRKRFVSRKLVTNSGDVILRYPNVWHRGTPNFSVNVRFMLGFVVTTQYRLHSPIKVTKAEYELLSDVGLPFHIEIGVPELRGFWPNYFSTSLVGQLSEATWVWANPVFRLLRVLRLIMKA